MNLIDGFGMDTITLAGSLDRKLAAVRASGFEQIMLNANDLVGYDGGVDAAIALVKNSGLRVTGFQVLRDFEGLSGHLHEYKLDIAKSMLQMCHQLGSKILLVCSSTSQHASDDIDLIARDLTKLATLALPLGIQIAYEGLSWGRTVNEYTTSWEIVERADWPNLGLALDSFHILAAETPLSAIEDIDPDRIFLVQLSDFMWRDAPTFEDRKATARTFRVFPGEGVHNDTLAELTQKIDQLGYQGDYSFEVFNDDYQQLPLETVCQRAYKSASWVAQDVLKRPLPLPDWTREPRMNGEVN